MEDLIETKKKEVFNCMMAELIAKQPQFNRKTSLATLAERTFEKIGELCDLIGEEECLDFEVAIDNGDHDLYKEWLEEIHEECEFCGCEVTNGWLLQNEECPNEACVSHKMTNPYGE